MGEKLDEAFPFDVEEHSEPFALQPLLVLLDANVVEPAPSILLLAGPIEATVS